MPLTLLVAVLVCAVFNHFDFHPLVTVAAPLHAICLAHAPRGDDAEFVRSLVCGAPLSSSSMTGLARGGLIHVFLLSLTLIAGLESMWLVTSRERSFWFRLGLVSVFLLFSGGRLSLLRGLFEILLGRFSRNLRLSWTTIQILVASAAITFAACETSSDMIGVAIGCAASLAFRGFQRPRPARKKTKIGAVVRLGRALTRLAFAWFLLAPLLLPWGVPSPLSILGTFFVGAPLAAIALPFALVTYSLSAAKTLNPDFASQASLFALRVWHFLRESLNTIDQTMPLSAPKLAVPFAFTGVYVTLLFLLAWWQERVS